MENPDNFRPTFSAHNCCRDCKLGSACTKPDFQCAAYTATCDGTRNCRPCPHFQPKDEKR